MPELDTILQTAERILNPDPDPVVRLRLLRDRSEKNGRWSTGWRLSAASTPARQHRSNPITPRSIQSGSCGSQLPDASSPQALITAKPRSALIVNQPGLRWQIATWWCTTNTHTLLSSRADGLPRDVEIVLFDWVWHNEGTVRHLGETPSIVPGSLEVAKIDRRLRCLELLASFPSWCRRTQGTIRWLWEQQARDGLWDFGRAANSVCLPLSQSWHRHPARPCDWTTRVLHLLRHYHRGQDEPFGIRVCVKYGND